MLPKDKICFLEGKWHVLLGLLAVLNGVLTQQCDCNLTAVMRATRAEETEKRAEDWVLNVTNSFNSYLAMNTRPTFDFYTKFDNYTKGNITKFVLRGYLYSLNWDNFTSGFTGLYNGYIYGNHSVCSGNYNCAAGWTNLTTFMRNDYVRNVMNIVGKFVTAMNYPVGLYRPWTERSYNYSNFNYTANPPQPCSCIPYSGYSYRVAFNISNTNLGSSYYSTGGLTNAIMQTDLELQLDDIAADKFGPPYIQSRFDDFDPLTNTSFYMWLYFVRPSSTGQISAEEINGNFSKLDALTMRWLSTTWFIASTPFVTDSCSYIKGQSENCASVTTSSSTIESTSTSAMTVSTQPSTVTSTITTTDSTTSTLTSETTIATTSSTTTVKTATSTSESPMTASVPSTSTTLGIVSPIVTNMEGTSMAFLATQIIPKASVLASASLTTQESFLPSSNGSSTSNLGTSVSLPLTATATPPPAVGVNSSAISTGLGLSSIIFTPASVTNQASTNHHLYSTTPFDTDPFFKAEVPIIPKVYNDKVLIKGHGGTVGQLTAQPLFYSIALPATLALLAMAIFCMLVWQIDCLPNAGPSKP